MPRDIHRALEQLEDYHSTLSRPSDIELKYAIEKVIGVFKTNLFHALCDIQDFYDNTLMNERISFNQKSAASRDFAARWESNPPFSGAYLRSYFPAATAAPATRTTIYTTTLPPTTEIQRPYSVIDNRFVDEAGKEWEVEEVLLDIRSVGLGFSITGGIDKPPDHLIRVTEILKDGAVARDGRVKINDIILKINDLDCTNIEHQIAVDAINQSNGFIRLVVKRPKVQRTLSQSYLADSHLRREEPPSIYGSPAPFRSRSLHQLPNPPHQPSVSSIANQSYQSFVQPTPPGRIVDPNAMLNLYDPRLVTLRKGEAGLGFNIVGGEDGEPIYISHILPGGVADLSGNVRKGDILLQVNDTNLRTASHQSAAIALRGAPGPFVHLTLQFRPKEFAEFENKVERLRQDMLAGRISGMR